MFFKARTAATLLCLPLLGALSSLPAAAQGTTVDDFQLVSGYNASGSAAATDSQGNLYTVGEGESSATKTGAPRHWVVRKSGDGGNTFSNVMTYRYPSGGSVNRANAVAVDAADNIFVAGEGTDSKGAQRWIVSKSADGGATWKVVDSPDVSFGAASGVCAGTTPGIVYVLGKGGVYRRGDQWRWVVRKSVDGGITWATVDSFQLASGYAASFPNAITVDSAGNVYVAGSANDSSNVRRWIVRKGVAGGTSWVTIDNFQYVSGQQSTAEAIAVDNVSGSVYVTGAGFASSISRRAIIRKVSTAGGPFVTIDDYQHEPGRSTSGFCLLIGPSGELVQGLNASVSTGGAWVIRSSYDGGATFSILDQYQLTAGRGGTPQGLAKVGTSLFAVGGFDDATPRSHWITRKY